MSSSTRWLALGAVVFAVGLYSGVARALDGAAVVDNRQAAMKAQGKDLGAVKAFIDDKGDLAAAQAAGADLVKRIGVIPSLFPKDTGMAQFPGKSYAKPAIWTEGDKFIAWQKTALGVAEALNTALKGGDKGAITTAFGNMVRDIPGVTPAPGGCGVCHGPFRENKPS